MKVSISIPDEMLGSFDKVVFSKYGPDKRSMVIAMMIKEFLMKHNYVEEQET